MALIYKVVTEDGTELEVDAEVSALPTAVNDSPVVSRRLVRDTGYGEPDTPPAPVAQNQAPWGGRL